MPHNICIHSSISLKLEQVKFNKLYKTKLGPIKGTVTYNNQPMLIRGPKMYLGADIVKNGAYHYIDLVFDETNKNNMNFLGFVKDIDYLAIAEIHANSKLWYQTGTKTNNEQISLSQIEHEYIPTIKLSAVYNDRQSFKLKIHVDQIEFYDQDNVVVPYQLLKTKCHVIPLLQLSAVYKDDKRIWAEWELPQLKAELNDILNGCQLVDIEDDTSEDDTVPENECDEDVKRDNIVSDKDRGNTNAENKVEDKSETKDENKIKDGCGNEEGNEDGNEDDNEDGNEDDNEEGNGDGNKTEVENN